MPPEDLAEMEAVDREGDGEGEEPRPPDQGPEEQLPVLEPLPADDAEPHHGLGHGPDMHEPEAAPRLPRRPVLLQERPYPGIVVLGGIDGAQDPPVPVDQGFGAHLRDKVHREIGIVAGHGRDDPALLLQAAVKLGACRRVQEPHHGGHDAALLDKGDQALEDRGRVLVEPHDEPRLDLEARVLDLLDVRDQVAVPVLELAALGEAFLVRRLDADEHLVEPGPDHERHQLLVVGKVDRHLGIEFEGMLAPFHPGNDGGQHFLLELSFVPDEVVVHDEDAAPPAPEVERVELGHDLCRILGPRQPAVEHRDVAEVAGKGAAAGILDVHGGVVLHVQEVEARRRGPGEVRPALGGIDPLRPALLQIREEQRQGDLRLVQHKMVHLAVVSGMCGKERPARDHFHARPACTAR